VAERFGGLDVLVNNAGVISMEPIVETTDEEYERMMNANVRSVYLASREAAKRMTAGGRIINIGSINADRAFGPGMTLYVTSKAAVAGFTRALAAELSEQGVTVDCIQPGPVDTDMNPADGEFADFARGFTALGRSPGRRRLRVSRRFWPVCRAATSPASPGEADTYDGEKASATG
jgi:3-oxoacyl-[acyl-carrier protein] reductase